MKKAFLGLPRVQKQMLAATVDAICLPLIFLLALILHFNDISASLIVDHAWFAIGTSFIAIPIFITLGLYRAVIRYIDQKIITAIIKGATLAVFSLAGIAYITQPQIFSWPPFVIYWLVSILYVLASRFLARGYFLASRKSSGRVRVAIYGAGEAGSLLANAVMPGDEYDPVFFVDDNPRCFNTTIRGLHVYPSEDLASLAKRHNVGMVLLAMPSLSRPEQRKILDRLALVPLKIKVTPSIGAMVNGKSRVQDVRQIEIEDLLRRDVVEPHRMLLAACINGKSVMVSGAGGSIGSELCRQIMSLSPRRLILLDVSEYALYTIEQEMHEIRAADESDVEVVAMVGSVLDTEKCTRIMTTFGVNTVYHAAAYKHVPLVEHNPIEGIRNNSFGTLSFAKAAVAANVECFVLISTDKAVRPTNVMGATKRLAELILQAFARRGTNTRFCMVRFGNVLGSSGSVVPLFRKQIAAGGPITLTHPDITRYFMTIPEAAQLVIQAGAMGKGGDVFVLDMGEPVRIADLAARMVNLSGQQVKSQSSPNGTIEINYVGLRPGEKLYEELLIGANVTSTEHPLIQRAQEAEIEWPLLQQMLAQLDHACQGFDHVAVRGLLQKLVREYSPSSQIADQLFMRSGAEVAAALQLITDEAPPVKSKTTEHLDSAQLLSA
jgi:FlaA1/EpsC-like NDP-sugar epimerase